MITMSELAKLAGVSQSTISRCLNDHPSISYETKERIRKLALQYGYVEEKKKSNTILSKQRRVIGILAEDQPFFDDLFINYTIHKLIRKAAEKNYYTVRLPISSQEEGGMDKLQEFLKTNLIDGFIIMHRHYDEKIHNYLTEHGIPHLYLLHCSRNFFESVDMVDTDNYMAGYLGTKYLADHGHRKILTYTCPWREFEDRTNGYLHVLSTLGIPQRDDYILMGECTYQSAYELTMRHIDLYKEATAVYIQSDIMALSVANALQQQGFRIPEDISIIGSDGYELGSLARPQLDSVAHPISDLTSLAIARLLEMISSSKLQTPQQIILKPFIIERSSVRTLESFTPPKKM